MVFRIGIDIVEIERIREATQRHGERFLSRCFTRDETAYCDVKRLRFQHLAGRFAAKEATFKAFGTGWGEGIKWKDVEVRNDPTGRPVLHLFGKARERAEQLKIVKSIVSISHCHRYAVACVIFER